MEIFQMATLSIPARIRLLRLLRDHGLRRAERLREDEMQEALKELPALLELWQSRLERGEAHLKSETPMQAPSSSTLHRRPVRGPSPASALAHARATIVDPSEEIDASLLLPEGERTFLRLIAVDTQTLFATWDLSSQNRRDIQEPVRLHLFVNRGTTPWLIEDIQLKSHNWYVGAPDERQTVTAQLVDAQDHIIATSNETIVPPSKTAQPGPLLFAQVQLTSALPDYANHSLADWIEATDAEKVSNAEFFVENSGTVVHGTNLPLSTLTAPSSTVAAKGQ
jgi:hypothetical protein